MPTKLRLLSYNIRFGGHARESMIAEVINQAQPDVVLLQEAIDRRAVTKLAELTGLEHWDSRPKASLGFLSRMKPAQYNWHWPRGARHPFLELFFDEPKVAFFGLHLSAWFSKWSERQRHFEVQALLEAIKQHQHGVHFIAGDFNALAPGETLRAERMPHWIRAMIWLSGRDLARHTIQHMLDQGYIDLWRTRHGAEEGYTFPVWDPHVRLDYIFTPERYRALVRTCEVVMSPEEARRASDHFPLCADLEIG